MARAPSRLFKGEDTVDHYRAFLKLAGTGLVVVLMAASCGGPTPIPPVITWFTAAPLSIVEGHSATLAWNVTGATSLSINQGVGSVSGATGSEVVSPTTTTTYTLTASNTAGTVTADATVTVTPAGPTTGIWGESTWDGALWGP
jgi:hypothetical protein